MSGTTGTPPGFQQTLVGYRQVTTQFSDTLLTVAARELQDATQWSKIAAINGLVPPYITNNPALVGPGVLAAGSPLFIPAPAPQASAVSDATDLFGSDLLLAADHANGDFQGELQDDGNGDFLTVTGTANLEQALYNRFGTRPGDLIYHLSYGCRVYTLLGKMAGPAAGTLGASWISQAAQSDPRVAGTSDMICTISADAVAFSGQVVANNGKRLPVGTSKLPGG